MTKKEFNNMSLAEQGLAIITEGKHITQIKKGDDLNNLYTIDDFFIEIIYSISTNEISKIEVLEDLSRIDQYIEGNQKNKKNKVKGAVSLN
ncbi:MAG TPA: hypothetical protein VJ896_08795 [Bacteroidales bacterium]|nr:hypothetical protein [Bacteroidales bacterium]